MTFHFVSDQDLCVLSISVKKHASCSTYTGKKSTASEHIQFSTVNKKLYKHCFKVYNKGVKVKEAIRH